MSHQSSGKENNDNWGTSSSPVTSWTVQQVLALIEVYKNHRLLYELKNPFYHHKNARRQALESITECVKGVRPNTTLDEVKVKLNSLRTQFNRQIATIKSKQRAGNFNYKGNLWCFEQLKFLEDFVVTRRARNRPATPQEQPPPSVPAAPESCVKSEPLTDGVDEEPVDDEEDAETQLIEGECPTTSSEAVVATSSCKRKLDDVGFVTHEVMDRLRSRKVAEWNNFGEFVSLEMQKLLSAKRQRFCKREMITVLMKYQQEEDNQFDY